MQVNAVDTTGLDKLRAQFEEIANPNPTLLLIRISKLMDNDNRDGVLAGLGGDNQSLAPVTYRPVSAKTGKRVKVGATLTIEQRLGQNRGIKRGRYSRIGSGDQRANNNLTTAEYRLLGGPPLAPRRQFSRVITNYKQDVIQIGPKVWEVIGSWVNVLSKKGVPFLHYHFDGVGQKRRDLRGIRPAGMEAIRATARKWMISIIQSGGSGG
jgi:hypothetical protein